MRKVIGIALCLPALALLCSKTLAMGELMEVTKETQAKLGLKFQMDAERIDSECVMAHITLPRSGKLKNISSVALRLGDGRPMLYTRLHVDETKAGAWEASVQLNPKLLDRASIDLTVPQDGRTYVVYSVLIKSYVRDRPPIRLKKGLDESP